VSRPGRRPQRREAGGARARRGPAAASAPLRFCIQDWRDNDCMAPIEAELYGDGSIGDDPWRWPHLRCGPLLERLPRRGRSRRAPVRCGPERSRVPSLAATRPIASICSSYRAVCGARRPIQANDGRAAASATVRRFEVAPQAPVGARGGRCRSPCRSGRRLPAGRVNEVDTAHSCIQDCCRNAGAE
jgi:hypothetical protein